jgi:hypothetical protein
MDKEFEEEYLKLSDISTKLEPNKIADDFRESKINELYGISPYYDIRWRYIKGIADTLEKLKTLGYLNEI